jgi:O-antigen/teichoic acid export membrane protein
VVGRLLGTTALGYYAVAFRLAAFPNSVIGTMVGRVAFPAYAMLQDDLPAFRAAFVQTLQRVALLAVPVSVALIVAGDPIVLGLFGEKWLPATDALRILSVYGFVTTFTSPCGAVYQAAGKPHLVPLWALPSAIVLVTALILLVPAYGLTGAAVAMLVAYSCSSVPALIVAMRLLELRLIDLLRSLAPSLACSALLGLALALLLPTRDWMSPALTLIVMFGVGSVVYICSTAVLAKSTVAPILLSLRGSRT